MAYKHYLTEAILKAFQDEGLARFIAYAAGPAPLKGRPVVFSGPEAVADVVFDGFCAPTLAGYLRRHRGRRTGILVRGCDRRAVRVLEQEKQIVREDLFLVGIPCPGMLNRTRLLEEFPGLTAGAVTEEGDRLTVQTAEGPRTLTRADYLLPACAACRHRVPEDVDLLLGPPPFGTPDPETGMADVTDPIAEMPRPHREALFREELTRCILCYACRNICPLCYCETCFTDALQPAWMTHAPEPDNIFFYQVNRMMHMAGRCVACGSCEWACPEHIQLHLLFGKVTADVADLFAYEAGIDAALPQPLSHFSEDDPDEHIG